MATQDIKEYLFQQTGIAESQWKRLSKRKNEDGLEVRIFQDKLSGKTVETVEAKDGTISIVDSVSDGSSIAPVQKSEAVPSDNSKKAIALIKKYYKSEGEAPDEDKPGFSDIPKFFKFSFLEDSNVDHTEALEDAAQAGNAQVAVTSFNLFFSPTFKASEEIHHLAPLLSPFLPDFLSETEEMCFTVHAETMHTYDDERIKGIEDGSIPNIPYDKLVATLEQAGFTYAKSECMLASLGGSQGATPFEEEKPSEDEKPSFCLVAVKNPKYEEAPQHYSQYLTALVVETPQKTSRDAKEKLLKKTLKKYACFYPGRLMNGSLPHIELLQLGKKTGSRGLDEKDWQTIYDILRQAGWKEDTNLASLENAQKWTLEQWAVTPMKTDPFIIMPPSKVSDHESAIEYYIWKPPSP